MNKLSSSFRDPSGYIFSKDSEIYRQINPVGVAEYRLFYASELYSTLTKKGYLIGHEEVSGVSDEPGITIKPDRIPFISYPYEWSFAQLKDAALLTLYIQMEALKAGFTLRDASAFNIQFRGGKPVFIDTLSFGKYEDGSPWGAYRQFCQHFLAPLALASYRHIGCLKLLRSHIDGIPLDLASSLLKGKKRFNLSLLTHIHWHSKTQKKYADRKTNSTGKGKVSKMGILGLTDNLISTIRKLKWNPDGTEWGDYYSFTNYSSNSFEQKRKLINGWMDSLKPTMVWDLGANDGTFSSIASERGIQTVAFDIDPIAVENNYRRQRKEKSAIHLPLLMDLTNPSPALGWAHSERDSLKDRGPADLIMSLALIHHLAISNNVPLGKIAEYFSELGRNLIIEFVPKGDSQVDILLATREDIFPDYNEPEFEKAFSQYFNIVEKNEIEGSVRTLYLMKSR